MKLKKKKCAQVHIPLIILSSSLQNYANQATQPQSLNINPNPNLLNHNLLILNHNILNLNLDLDLDPLHLDIYLHLNLYLHLHLYLYRKLPNLNISLFKLFICMNTQWSMKFNLLHLVICFPYV
ncbi:hypothetical protein CR513_28839, partial [Mucuna pruriens]